MKETRFAKLLKDTGISGAHIARKCGVSAQTVSKWAVGKAKPATNELMNMVALAMNVPYNELLGCFFYEEKPKKWWKKKTEVN
jgi:transcriptional regulator with XRE-family HTH domain